jgi:uncharacterized protein
MAVLPRAIITLWTLFWFGWVGAQGVLPVPPLTALVVDRTGTLDAIQQKGLVDKLLAFEQTKGTQIAILLVGTTQPEDIASYANRVANEWKIGRRAIGDGVLLVVAKNDRRVHIEVAKTLEGAIPDLAAKQIIDETITPNFRKVDYAAGLHAAVDQLSARITGEALPAPKGPARTSGPGFDWMDTAIFLFIAVPVVGGLLRSMFGRKLGSLVTGGGVGALALFLTSSLVIAAIAAFIALLFSLLSGGFGGMGTRQRGGWGGGPYIGGWGGGGGGGGSWGGGGGGSGGGWGGSGGGGDFGGGGASGDW